MAIFLYAIFFVVALQEFSLGADTLLPNQTISYGQTLISQSQIFELGFFHPGSSRNSFLGIWYKTTPDVVVWVANRNNPITDSQGATFTVVGNGTLVISSGRNLIWSANSSRVASYPVLQLLNTGNLVVSDKASKDSAYTWQSFDYPSDTRLPGMKIIADPDSGRETFLTSWRNLDDPSPGDFSCRIQNHGLPDLVILKGTDKVYRTGPWNGVYFSGLSSSGDPLFKREAIFKKDVLTSITEVYTDSVITRVTIDQSGLVQRYSMNDRKDRWKLVYTMPRDLCDNYAQCGPYGVCKIDKTPICECLKGFSPKAQRDWDWSGGCVRIRALNCKSGDGFQRVEGVKFPDMLRFWLNTSMSLGECRDECSKNCSCTAYANPYVTDGGRGCLMWFGDLVDIREIHGADSKQIVYVRLPVSLLDSHSSTNIEKGKDKEKKKSVNIIMISTAIGVLVSGFIHGGIVLMTRQNKQAKRDTEDLELPIFKWATIVDATNSFSRENMIGEGGFGPVYRGSLSVEEEIAVKRLSRTSGQGLEEFKNEVTLIAKLQHRNLVKLLGCCIEGEERLLIYEYLQNQSLDYFVFDQNRRALLTWPKRFDIIMGIARGLLYLHHDSRLKIIHRDLKTSNILLDGNLNPKISDFGIARMFAEDQSMARTKRVVGTYGYMAPEYAFDGKFSVKSDIFSMGVVMLEIVSGKRNRGFDHRDHYHTLLGHAWLLWKENKILEVMDECLNDAFIKSQVMRCIQVGLLCVQKFAEDRPDMSSVLFMLATDGAILPDPKEPGFFSERSSNPVISDNATASTESEKGTMTITDLEAR